MAAFFDRTWARRELLRFERPWSPELQRWSEKESFPLDVDSFIDQLGDPRYHPLSDLEQSWLQALRVEVDRRQREARQKEEASQKRIEETDRRAKRAEWVSYFLLPFLLIVALLLIYIVQRVVGIDGKIGTLQSDASALEAYLNQAEVSATTALVAAQAPLKALNLNERAEVVKQLRESIGQVDGETATYLDLRLKNCGEVNGEEPDADASVEAYVDWAVAANAVVLCQERALLIAVSTQSIRATEGVKRSQRVLDEQGRSIERQAKTVQDQAGRVAELERQTETALAEARTSRELTKNELIEFRQQSQTALTEVRQQSQAALVEAQETRELTRTELNEVRKQSKLTAQKVDDALTSGVKSTLQAAMERCFKESVDDTAEKECLRRAFGIQP
jgi:hypothetical protein